MRAWQQVETTEVDGVPLVLADDGGGLVAAGLTFRVGWADEQVRHRGVTHLVEHLAHVDLPSRTVDHNAWVDATETVFWARGRPAEVTAHLHAIVAGLSSPDLDEYRRERGVLRAEGGMSRLDLLDRRFANRGFGGRSWREFILEQEDPTEVARWARERFTRSAAVAWSTGALPELDLSGLPVGRAPSWPTVERPPGWTPRRHVVWESTAVAWSGEVADGWAGSVALNILEDRATARLRRELGTSYAITTGAMVLDPSSRVRFLHADRGTESSAVQVRDVLLDGLDALADRGPSGDELAALREVTVRNLEDHHAAQWLATMGATELQQGRTPLGAQAVLGEWEALTSEEVLRAAAELRDSLLLAVPFDARPGDELPGLDRTSDRAFDAPLYVCSRRQAGKLRDPDTESADVCVVAGSGVSSTAGGHTVTIRFDQATLAVVVDDITVHVFDASDRCVSACVHDARDRAAFLEPVEAALGPDRLVRITRGRDRALDRIRELAGEQLGSRVRVNGLAYIASLELEPFEEVVGLAAARHEGAEGLVLLTPGRLIYRSVAEAWWIDLPGVASVDASEGARGGRVRLELEGGAVAVLERIRAKGRASAIAEAVRVAREGRTGVTAAVS